MTPYHWSVLFISTLFVSAVGIGEVSANLLAQSAYVAMFLASVLGLMFTSLAILVSPSVLGRQRGTTRPVPSGVAVRGLETPDARTDQQEQAGAA